MPGELYQIYANKAAIDEKRIAIKDSGFSANDYWSSREFDSDSEYYVNLYSGYIRSNYNKSNINYVLGFLALEV